MKIKICFLTALSCMICLLPCRASAQEIDLLASPDKGKAIESNILEDDEQSYGFLFGTSDVEIMFEYAMPYYTYNFERTYTRLQDLYDFTGSYIVPVKSWSGEFIAFAEYSRTSDNKWEIVSTSAGEYYDGLYDTLMSDSIFSGYSSAFLTGDFLFNELGVVLQNDSTVYFDYSSHFSDSSSTDYRTQFSLNNYFVSEDVKAAELVLTPIIDSDTDSGFFNQDIDWDEANDPSGVVDEYDDSPIEDDLSNSGLGIDEWVYEEPEEDNEGYVWTPSPEDNNTDGGVPDEGDYNDTEPSSPNTGNTSSAIAVASLCGALCLVVISRKKK